MLRDKKSPIDKCPYCGNDYGYYTKDYVSGHSTCNYTFSDMEKPDNVEDLLDE